MVSSRVAFRRTPSEPFFPLTQEFLTDLRQFSIKTATVSIEGLLKKSVETQKPHKTAPNWRTHDLNFVENTSTDAIEPGTVTFSGGWFAQGHAVSFLFHYMTRTDLTFNLLDTGLSAVSLRKPT
jgi:hypothetical protein